MTRKVFLQKFIRIQSIYFYTSHCFMQNRQDLKLLISKEKLIYKEKVSNKNNKIYIKNIKSGVYILNLNNHILKKSSLINSKINDIVYRNY